MINWLVIMMAGKIRKDYMARLIANIREQIAEEDRRENPEALKKYPESVSALWLDMVLLCDVVEENVLGKNPTKLASDGVSATVYLFAHRRLAGLERMNTDKGILVNA